MSKKSSQMSLEASLALRPITLRHQRQRDIFRLQEGLCRGFRDFLHSRGFTEIHTPKIVSSGAEADPIFSGSTISAGKLIWPRARSFTSR